MTMISKMSEGLGRTCAIFFLTLLFALPLGLMVAKLRMSKNKVVSAIMKAYISILRGTPLMLQLLAVTYGPYYLFGITVAREKLIPVVIAFSLNYADAAASGMVFRAVLSFRLEYRELEISGDHRRLCAELRGILC